MLTGGGAEVAHEGGVRVGVGEGGLELGLPRHLKHTEKKMKKWKKIEKNRRINQIG